MTILIIAVTGIISFLAFGRKDLFDKLKFNAYLIYKYKQYHRFFSYGLIHADWGHLLINMFVLFSFGELVEEAFEVLFGIKGYFYYFLLYAGGIAFSTLYDFGAQKDNGYYNAVGASGAVAAVLFSSIIIFPTGKIALLFFPIGIPAPIFGLLYIAYSVYMARKGTDNIGHTAHFFGALYGILFTIAIKPALASSFFESIFTY